MASRKSPSIQSGYLRKLFTINKQNKFIEKTVKILVDDFISTGATIKIIRNEMDDFCEL